MTNLEVLKMTRSPAIRVIKVGGSLLDMPDLPKQLRDWLANQSLAHNVLVAGGGQLVEQVRRWHRGQPPAETERLDEVTAHWICIDLMSVTARLLHAWLPDLKYTAEMRLLERRMQEPGGTLFDVAKWLRSEEPTLPGTRLPCQWEVTSDSITARLAVALAADELVLLKSSWPKAHGPKTEGSKEEGPVKEGQSLVALAEEGYIDRMLPLLAPELPPLRMVNLRS
jgi:aspartokinase-like uncharacterized kinase